MNFEPQKFFIGLVDFFSILLPGAVLAYLLRDTAGPWILRDRYARLQGTEAWVVLFFTSYLLGHFLFLIGSLLDDYVYDPVRRRTDKEQVTRLLNHRQLSPRLLRWLARVCFKKHADAALNGIVPIKEGYLKRIEAPGAVNAFQWCKARLAIEHPDTSATVNRFEADSKFFRSFVPVLAGSLGIALYREQWWLAVVSVVSLALAFWRYMEQRFKSTQQAYWTILTLEAAEAAKKAPHSITEPSDSLNSGEASSGPTHAGGVVFRARSAEKEYLLVEATTDPDEWVLPKGHIESGEDPRRSAIREVREETGVWARILNEIKVVKYTLAGKTVRVQFYVMEAVEEGKPEDRLRRHAWLSLARALGKVTHAESKELLRLADQNSPH